MNNKCPCCSGSLLRHWKNDSKYWFCLHCRQEMPNLEALEQKYHFPEQEQILTKSLSLSRQLINLNSAKKVAIKS